MAIDKTIGANLNRTDTATSDAITLNTSTSTIIQVANRDRIYFYVRNHGNQPVVIKLQRAAIDDLDTDWIVLEKDEVYEMPGGQMYFGEICAIATVDAPVVRVVEY